MKLRDIRVDSKVIEAGEWVDAPGLLGIRFQVRGLGNAGFKRLQAKLNEAVPRSKRLMGRIDPAEADRITTTLVLDTILLGWDGIEDDGGAVIPFGRDEAEKLLNDPDYRALKDSILAAAAMVGEARAEDLETDAKN